MTDITEEVVIVEPAPAPPPSRRKGRRPPRNRRPRRAVTGTTRAVVAGVLVATATIIVLSAVLDWREPLAILAVGYLAFVAVIIVTEAVDERIRRRTTIIDLVDDVEPPTAQLPVIP